MTYPWAKRVCFLRCLIRVGLGLLFVYAGGVKMIDPVSFAESIKGFELTTPWATRALTFGVPALEIVAGIILAAGMPSLWRGASAVLAALLVGFSLAVASAWGRGLGVSCGCFGDTTLIPSSPAWWLARNTALIGLLFALHLRSFGGARRVETARD